MPWKRNSFFLLRETSFIIETKYIDKNIIYFEMDRVTEERSHHMSRNN